VSLPLVSLILIYAIILPIVLDYKDYEVKVSPPTEKDRKWMEFARLARLRAAEVSHKNSALVRELLNDKDLSKKLHQAAQDNKERAQHHADLAAQTAQPNKAHVYHLIRTGCLLRAGWFKKDGRSANMQTRCLSNAHYHLIPSRENLLKGAHIAGRTRIKRARKEYAHALDHGPSGHCHREDCEAKEPLSTGVIAHHHPSRDGQSTQK
jgi:hypothetical protein